MKLTHTVLLSCKSAPTYLWCFLLLASICSRFCLLDHNPIHADEATGASLLALRLEQNHYQFDPQHFHGPLLSACAAQLAHLFQENTWVDLQLQTLRKTPALCGLAMTLLPFFYRRRLGSHSALLASAFLISSPLITYYNRLYIHESLLAALALWGTLQLMSYLQKPSITKALILGTLIGLMFATKASFIFTVAGWALAACFFPRHARPLSDASNNSLSIAIRQYSRTLILVAACALLSASYFYSNGFQDPGGILAAFESYFVYELMPGHRQPFNTYWQWLIWPKYALGQIWTEIAIAGAAIFSLLRLHHCPVARFLALSSALQFLIYACLPYKTPWLMLVPWSQLCVLAGLWLQPVWPAKGSLKKIALCLILALMLSYQSIQCYQASICYPNDPRNPYAYVPTSRNVEALGRWIQQLQSMQPNNALQKLTIIGKEFWPLPWFLKTLQLESHSEVPTKGLQNKAFIISMPAQASSVSQALTASHQVFTYTLRSHVVINFYLRNDLWEQWKQID